MATLLSDQEHQRIADAIRSGESRTSGEIYCVLAQRSDSYTFPALVTLTAMLLALSLVAAVVLDRFWVTMPLTSFVAAQIAAFTCAALVIAALPGLRPRLVPRSLRYRRAHDNAQKQFLGHNIHLTEARTGVLIFVSLAERYAEIVADAGIDDRVEQRQWDEAVAALAASSGEGRIADGFIAAIESAGALLARHFPPTAANPNEIEDRLVEI